MKFQGEHGSAMTEKFRKLMGIKSDDNNMEMANQTSSGVSSSKTDLSSNQEKLFENLDMQYSIARISTHMNRGVGLGFSAANNRLL